MFLLLGLCCIMAKVGVVGVCVCVGGWGWGGKRGRAEVFVPAVNYLHGEKIKSRWMGGGGGGRVRKDIDRRK